MTRLGSVVRPARGIFEPPRLWEPVDRGCRGIGWPEPDARLAGRIALLLLLMVFCLSGCHDARIDVYQNAKAPASPAPSWREGPSCEELYLSAGAVSVLEPQALDGGPEQALKVSVFYATCGGDPALSDYWLEIAAENGDYMGQHNLAHWLRESKGARDRLRAGFWPVPSTDEGEVLPGCERVTPAEGVGGKLECEALRGSREASLRLHYFYEFERNDPAESLYWARISAQNGNPMGQYEYGLMLSKDPDPKNQRRSLFWLRKAADKGIEPARLFLKNMPNN